MAVTLPTDEAPTRVLWGFALVWVISSTATVGVIRLGFSGMLWRLGFPPWLTAFTLLVGIWQWLWVLPLLMRARRQNRRGFYSGMLTGAISFSLVNIAACMVVLIKLRHFSMQ